MSLIWEVVLVTAVATCCNASIETENSPMELSSRDVKAFEDPNELTVKIQSLENTLSENTDHGNRHDAKRRKRSPIGFVANVGKIAAKLLLKGAKKTGILPPKTTNWEKPGTLQQAMKDFYAVRPSDVRKIPFTDTVYGLTGDVGDRTIMLINKNRRKNDGRPIVIIKKYRSELGVPKKPNVIKIDQITYTD